MGKVLHVTKHLQSSCNLLCPWVYTLLTSASPLHGCTHYWPLPLLCRVVEVSGRTSVDVGVHKLPNTEVDIGRPDGLMRLLYALIGHTENGDIIICAREGGEGGCITLQFYQNQHLARHLYNLSVSLSLFVSLSQSHTHTVYNTHVCIYTHIFIHISTTLSF